MEELLSKAKSAKDLGAAAMALTSVYNVKQLSSGGATRISGNTQDSTKAKGFDHFMQLAQAELQKRQQTVLATALPADSGRVVIEAETVAVNDQVLARGDNATPKTLKPQ